MSSTNEPKPRPHCEVIKAWADGAEVQRRYVVPGTDWDWEGPWLDDPHPDWDKDFQYRVKPEE